MATYTVKQVARMSGVSVRTLHYYDEIGLLKPAAKGDNGYRYYGRTELERLQQILFYREMRVPLGEVRRIMSAPDFDRLAALQAHRLRLVAEARHAARLLHTLDRAIADLTGDGQMKDEELFHGLDSPRQKQYEAWLVDRHGGEMPAHIEQSRRQVKNWSKDDWARSGAEAEAINQGLHAAMLKGLPADDDEVQAHVDRHFRWILQFWTPNREAYAGLGQLYRDHPDFRSFYDRTGGPGLVDFLAEAMQVYAERRLG